MNTLTYALIMLVAGIGIPTMAALNAQLGLRVGSPAVAATVLFLIAFCCALLFVLLTAPSALRQIVGHPPHLYLGGTLVAFYVLSITFIAPRFGVGNAVMFVLLGQLIAMATIDHFGLFGVVVKPLTLQRAAGLMIMASGLALAIRA